MLDICQIRSEHAELELSAYYASTLLLLKSQYFSPGNNEFP